MNWKLDLLIVLGVITTVASIIGSLDQILNFLGRVTRPMLRRHYIGRHEWPIRITVSKYQMYRKRIGVPDIYEDLLCVVLLVTPRKLTILGKCKIVSLDDKTWERDPEEWEIGKQLDVPITYDLIFPLRGLELPNQVQVVIEAEGYTAESNIVKVDKS